MLEDVLLIQKKHRTAAGRIVQLIDRIGVDKTILSIGGESGSGKSVVAHATARLLKTEGVRVKIIHTDNYYKIPPRQRTQWRQANGIDSVGVGEYDLDLLAKHIDAFKNNRKAQLPCVDLISDQVDQLSTDFSGIQMIILEGLYALSAASDLKTFIDLTYEDTRGAQQLRRKERMDDFRLSILQQEHRAIQAFRGQADILITKDYRVISNSA
ncbi:MAG: uridine kinase [Desulfobacteraceae bacterium]|nr:uridine kinase [Desulfobacteraceae bacterium]